MNFLKHKLGPYILIFMAAVVAHVNFLFPDVAENPDSNFIHPFLNRITSPWDYILKLASLETIDFQPVRDLTLFVDLWVLRNTGVNVTIFFNFLIWVFSCWVVFSIIKKTFHTLEEKTILLLVSCFSVYPIFLQSINWGIARKHLLAFMFTLLATRTFLSWIETQRGALKIILFYTLSVLSIPISIGFPVWCFLYLKLLHPEKLTPARRFLTILIINMLLLVLINYAYYNTSWTYLELYPPKAKMIYPSFVILNLGQQIWQMLYPYNLSFHYTFQNGAAAGFLIFLISIVYAMVKLRNRKDIWIWILFGAAHVAIILTTPLAYYDTYIIAPTFAFFMIIIHLFGEKIAKFRPALMGLYIFWAAFTFSHNKIWGTTEDFFIHSFKMDRSCPNAVGLGISKYLKEEKIPDDLYDFLQVNKCVEVLPTDTVSMTTKKIVFESYMMYYETEIDYDYRKLRLIELGLRHFYPNLVYATLLSRENKLVEIEYVMKRLNAQLAGTGTKVGDERIFSKIMPDYCRENQLSECNKFVELYLDRSSQ